MDREEAEMAAKLTIILLLAAIALAALAFTALASSGAIVAG
jgi:hypothetical protein